MKTRLTVALMMMGAMTTAGAMEIKPSGLSCADLADKYQLTAEGQERIQNLIGSCHSVVEINGALFAQTTAVIRAPGSRSLRVYLPATDRTIEVHPDPELRVDIDGRKVRPSELQRGDQISIYIAVDSVAELKPIETVKFTADTPPEAPPQAVPVPVTPIAALPTTASPVPALGLLGLGLLGLATTFRRMRRK